MTPAPFFLLSSLDPVTEVFVVENKITASFVETLRGLLAEIEVPLIPVLHLEVENDLWMQDTVEIGYRRDAEGKCFPAALGGLRGKHKAENIVTAPLDEKVKHLMRDKGIEVIEVAEPRADARWIDWFGNLEVSPPVQDSAGKVYPNGRILTGKQHELTLHPDAIAFLEAQGVQTPLVFVDVSWLTIGHVDEVINFVPADNEKGFKVILPSPQAARRILESAVMAGYGETSVFAETSEALSVNKFLSHFANSAENIAIDAKIEKTVQQLKVELGLNDQDFAFLPALFEGGFAVIPNPVNCLVANSLAIIPDPQGPVIRGKDVFQQEILRQISSTSLRVRFVNIWDTYHIRGGEIHCGTNALRTSPASMRQDPL